MGLRAAPDLGIEPLVEAELSSLVQQRFAAFQRVAGADEFAVGHVSEAAGVFRFSLVVQLSRIRFWLRIVAFLSDVVELLVAAVTEIFDDSVV